MVAESEGRALDQEPLRWLMRGCPGAGKSHVIQILKERFFKDVLHWDLGIQFQIVALQAVMAELLVGDTLHHVCGTPAFKQFAGNDVETGRCAVARGRVRGLTVRPPPAHEAGQELCCCKMGHGTKARVHVRSPTSHGARHGPTSHGARHGKDISQWHVVDGQKCWTQVYGSSMRHAAKDFSQCAIHGARGWTSAMAAKNTCSNRSKASA